MDEINRYLLGKEPTRKELRRQKEEFIKLYTNYFGVTAEKATKLADEHFKFESMQRQLMREDPFYNPYDYDGGE